MEYHNHEQFIENYELTKEEYLVLSFEERMEYANQLFGYKVLDLNNIGDTIVFGSVIDSRFYEYFEYCGCRVTQDDLGAEITEVTKIGENNYKPQEGAKQKLEKHIRSIAKTKIDIVGERKNNFYKVVKKRKSRQFREKFDYIKEIQKIRNCKVENLPAYEKRWLMPVELENLITSINNGTEEYLDLFVSEEYIYYLNRNGYKVEKDNNTKRYLLHKSEMIQ